MSTANRAYRFLDSDEERRELVADIRRVRQNVIQLAESVPDSRHYEPRYGVWSLGALLAHLYVSDRLALWGIQWALVGLRAPIPPQAPALLNDMTSRVFRSRLTATSIRSLRAHEKRIVDLILRLPVSRFTRQVYDPGVQGYLTVEQALQVAFLFHWQEHLEEMQRVEGLFYEPPERFDTV